MNGEFPERSNGSDCKSVASATEVQILHSPKMRKLELTEKSFPYIFSSSEIANIILDKEKKIFQVIFRDCPMVEMFLNEKFKYNTICFYAHGWDNVLIKLRDENTKKSKQVDTVIKTRLLIIKRKNLRKPIFGKKTIFYGPIKNNGSTLQIIFSKLLSHDFYEME